MLQNKKSQSEKESLVISFYTDDGDYPMYAKLLSEDCERLGLDYYISEKQSLKDYRKNCNIKPFFIKETLERFKRPVLWMDVDGSIISSPDLIFDETILEYDIAANCAVNNETKIRVGSIWFNYTKAVMSFVDNWCESVSNGGIDDGQFNSTWKKHKDIMKLYKLPQNYFVVLQKLNSTPPDDSCIVHRLSNSLLKQKYKCNKK